MALDMKKFLTRYADEGREHMRTLAAGVAALERSPDDTDTLNLIFRTVHTLKGSSRMLRLDVIADTAHHLEDLLSALRDGTVRYSGALGSLLYRASDALAALIELATGSAPLPALDAHLCEALAHAAAAGAEPTLERAPLPATATATPVPPPNAVKPPETVRIRLSKLDELLKLMGELVSCNARTRQRLSELRILEREMSGTLEPASVKAGLHRFGQHLRDDGLASERLIEQLHGTVLAMRMLPLAILFDPVGRMLRELAQSISKQVDYSVHGSDMELDRHLVDRLGEPLMHLLRNALDHGIELPPVRLARGKHAAGSITLSARQDGAAIVIDVTDDGAGIDSDLLREKAVRRGLLTEQQALALRPDEAIDLIFLPGLSTSAIVTDTSGRGVGMDVVKRCIVDQLQGDISVRTEAGRGTTFSLRLPLSLALTRVLMVRVRDIAFGFVAHNVLALVRVPEPQLVMLAGRRALILHNEFVPVVALDLMLDLPDHLGSPRTAHPSGQLVLVLRARHEKLGLLIDTLEDERDMVISPLPPHMRNLALMTGMVMYGHNELVSILHAPALLERARSRSPDTVQAGESAVRANLRRRILVVDDSFNTREIEKDVLEAHGYQVALVEDGKQAIELAEREQFDAVLTDVEMPNMDGFALTRHLRAQPRYRATPIIIITSRAREQDKRRGIEVGADAYIVKGDFEENNLLTILANLLG